MKVAIIKYNAGNIYSVYCACRRLGHNAVITDDPVVIRQADRVIFPGVGEARAAMQHLNSQPNWPCRRDSRPPTASPWHLHWYAAPLPSQRGG